MGMIPLLKTHSSYHRSMSELLPLSPSDSTGTIFCNKVQWQSAVMMWWCDDVTMWRCDYDWEWPAEADSGSRVQFQRQNFNMFQLVSSFSDSSCGCGSAAEQRAPSEKAIADLATSQESWKQEHDKHPTEALRDPQPTQTTKSHQITMHTQKLLKLLLGHSRAKWLLSEGRSCSWSNRQVPSRTKWAPVWNLFEQFWTCFCTASINASTCFKFQHGLSLRLEIKCVSCIRYSNDSNVSLVVPVLWRIWGLVILWLSWFLWCFETCFVPLRRFFFCVATKSLQLQGCSRPDGHTKLEPGGTEFTWWKIAKLNRKICSHTLASRLAWAPL